MGGSPFIIMSRVNMIGFARAAPLDRFLVEIASEKVVNCHGASSRQSDKEYLQPKTISNPSLDVFELIANPSSAVSIMKMIFRLLRIRYGAFQLYRVFHWFISLLSQLIINNC